MPIYEYVCEGCARRVEVFHGIESPRPTTCEVCGGTLRKAISSPAIVFKGSGWAKVDARSAAGRGAKAVGDASPTDGGKGDAPAKEAAASSDSTTSGREGSASGREGNVSGREGNASGHEGKASRSESGGGGERGGAGDRTGRSPTTDKPSSKAADTAGG
jgi:putative FmdB family regulatory protein